MHYLYTTFLYEPLLNALVFLYTTVAFRDLGVAIILLTVVIRFILFPFFHKSVRHQMAMQRLQPHVKQIQETHKHDKEKQGQALMELYRTHKVNPLSGFFLLLIQLPILIALYQLFIHILSPNFLSEGLYPFVHAPAVLGTSFLGLINLKEQSIFMVGLAAIAQYIQGRLAFPPRTPGIEPTDAEKMGRRMILIGPLLTLLVFWRFPAAISLYWVVSSAFSSVQQLIVSRQMKSPA